MSGNAGLFPRLAEFSPAFKQQADFMADTKRFVGVIASARSGKTHTSAPKFLARVAMTQSKLGGKPLEYWIITPTADLAAPIKIKLMPLIPQTAVDWVRQGRDMQFFNVKTGGGSLILKNGAILRFKSFEQGESLVASTVGGIWVDECARCNNATTWGNLLTRLATTRGWCIMSSSPAQKSDFYHSVYRLNEKNPEWGWHAWNAYDAANGGVLAVEEVESAKRRLPKHVFEREFLASWSSAVGQVYDCFVESKHVVNFFPDRRKSRFDRPHYFIGLDVGASHPTACYVVSELHLKYHVERELRLYTPSLSRVVKEVRQLAEEFKPERVYFDYSPGGAFFAREWMTTPGVNSKLVIPAWKNIVEGIACVYDAVAEDRLLVHRSCGFLIEEIQSLVWREDTHKEETVKEKDDSVDALRYAVASHEHFTLKIPRRLRHAS